MIVRGLKIHTCRTTLQMEGGVFFKELRTEGGRGSGGPALHTHTFPDLVPPGPFLWQRVLVQAYCIKEWIEVSLKVAKKADYYFCYRLMASLQSKMRQRHYTLPAARHVTIQKS